MSESKIVTCIRRLTFEAGHRVYGHETVCKNPHGHSYKVFIHASAPKLDSLGRVVDFKFLKQKFGTWIDEHWDHAFLFFSEDVKMMEIFTSNPEFKSYSLPMNPTAENLAIFIKDILAPTLMEGYEQVTITKVEVHETENCSAEVAA